MMKFDRKTIMLMIVIAAIILLLSAPAPKAEAYELQAAPLNETKPAEKVGSVVPKPEIRGMDIDADEDGAPIDGEVGPMVNLGCAMNAGVGLASSLLPREVAKTENFGEFAPEEILKGQNFLDPRQQIGMPETIGGNLRNANQQIRADPPNPKHAYEWNNSTIVPDLMQRKICT